MGPGFWVWGLGSGVLGLGSWVWAVRGRWGLGLVPMKGWQQPTAICLEPYFGVSMSAGSQDHLLSLQAMQLPGPDDSLLLTDLDGIENFWLLPAAVKPYLSHGIVRRMGDEGSAAPQTLVSFIHGIVLRTLRAKILIPLEASETSQTLP